MRTGGEIQSKHVAIVGLGSIGSRVAEHLTLAGIDRLSLIDNEVFSSDNLGRHVLGLSAINQKKATSMCEHLKNRLPEINVSGFPSSCEAWLSENNVLEVDVLVLTTGNHALERGLVRRAYTEKWRILLVVAWVEAAGAGGHALACMPGIPGCLDCLFTDENNTQSLICKGAFVEAGQKISRQLNGCRAFTPYSAIDATQTALLAADLVLKGSPGYRRWAGDPKKANSEGIRLTALHDALFTGKVAGNIPAEKIIVSGCLCCGI